MVGRLELRDNFKEEAEWRRENAKQYSNDERYLAAAAIFDRLKQFPAYLNRWDSQQARNEGVFAH
jgi:hypothetical protein